MSQPSDRPRSRRELVADILGRGLSGQEEKQVAALLDLEHLAVDIYGRAAATPYISPRARPLIRRLRAQERIHAAALARLLRTRQRRREVPREDSAAALEAALAKQGIVITFADLRTERAWFTLLEELEGALESAYYKSLLHLTSPSAAKLVAQIMASEAQHSTLLFRLRNPRDIKLDVAVGLVKGRATS